MYYLLIRESLLKDSIDTVLSIGDMNLLYTAIIVCMQEQYLSPYKYTGY